MCFFKIGIFFCKASHLWHRRGVSINFLHSSREGNIILPFFSKFFLISINEILKYLHDNQNILETFRIDKKISREAIPMFFGFQTIRIHVFTNNMEMQPCHASLSMITQFEFSFRNFVSNV